MLLTEILSSFLGRRISRATHRLTSRRRHHDTLRQARVSKEDRARARATWWGKDPRWYPGGAPPRLHNLVTPLVDGEAYFAALQEAINGAQDYIYVVGWCLTPYLPLVRETEQDLVETRFLTLLSEASKRLPVRLLLWAGAPFFFQPTTHIMEAVRATFEEQSAGDLECRLDHSAHFSHCHHQKAIVVDGRVAFVGGIDATTDSGDRWDTGRHPLRAGRNWHDAAVRIEGEAVADVEHNFRQRWRAVTGDEIAEKPARAFDPVWKTPVQIVRTIPAGVYRALPLGEFGIHHIYVQALRRAERLIYIENQYLWSPDVVGALITAMDRPHRGPFRVVIVLPASADDGKLDNDKHVDELLKADSGRGIVSAYSLYTSGPNTGRHAFTYRPIYVHAKVCVIDDEWFTVGSANLNNRGLVTDSEINALVHEPEMARNLRVALWAEHLWLPREQVADATAHAVADREWPERAAENERIIQNCEKPLICAVRRYQPGREEGAWLFDEAEAVLVEH
ncbi:MAG: phospholipase D-like domain-containing protein [Chloroflexia bacterium]